VGLRKLLEVTVQFQVIISFICLLMVSPIDGNSNSADKQLRGVMITVMLRLTSIQRH
jgi:hypothetical protein